MRSAVLDTGIVGLGWGVILFASFAFVISHLFRWLSQERAHRFTMDMKRTENEHARRNLQELVLLLHDTARDLDPEAASRLLRLAEKLLEKV
jgi:hypothetical protein